MANLKVVIDPGHGGRDPGAVGPTGLREKNVTLAVSKRIAAYLQAAGVATQLTRSTDTDYGPTDVDIGHRARQIVNKSGAQVCVSVHCNSFGNLTANGIETFHYPGSTQGKALAAAIQDRLIAATGRTDRGVKTGTFGMIRIPSMPAVLVELPFISNPAEEKLLRDPGFQDKCARAITAGILDYAKRRGFIVATITDAPSKWAESVWKWAKDEGYFDGTRPKDAVTREELAAILQRVTGKLGGK